MTVELTFRLVRAIDCARILMIYAPYVRDTALTFEVEVPTIEAFVERTERIASRYPYIVCEENGEIVGYAYASRHRERDGYRYDVDMSVYVAQGHQGSGVAAQLYERLLVLLERLGYYNAYAACVAVNERSRRFHEKFGFVLVGTHHKTGYKLGQWYDAVWLEKMLRDHGEAPGEILGIAELSMEAVRKILGGDYS